LEGSNGGELLYAGGQAQKEAFRTKKGLFSCFEQDFEEMAITLFLIFSLIYGAFVIKISGLFYSRNSI